MATIDNQLAELLGKNAALFAAYGQWSDGQIMLLAGTVDDPDSFDADGGKAGALGYYPVVDVSGNTRYVPSIARLRALALGGANSETLDALLQTTGQKLDAVDTARERAETVAGEAQVQADRAKAQADAIGNISNAVVNSQVSASEAQLAAQAATAAVGTINRAVVLSIDPTIVAPPVATWRTTAGRYRRDPDRWVECVAGAERTCYAPQGALLGVLLEGPDHVFGARWHDPAAPHAATDPAYLAKTAAGDAIAYAGSHPQADILGGIGRCVELTQGSAANGIHNALGITTAVSLGDIVRIDGLFVFPATGTATTFSLRNLPRSGTQPTLAATVAIDANGVVTGWSGALDPNNRRGGFSTDYTDSAGRPVWYLWFEYRSTGEAVISPGVGFGSTAAVVGRKVVVHDLRVRRNTKTPPSSVPVLAAAKLYDGDVLDTGIRQQIGAIFHGVARARSRVTDGRLSLAPGYVAGDMPIAHVSGPTLPVCTRIEIVPSTEDADLTGFTPNARQTEDTVPWLNPTDFRPCFGPGYFNERITVTTTNRCINYTVVPVFRKNALLKPRIERIRTSRTFLTGNLTIDDTIIVSRASEITKQFEQVDLLSDTSALHDVSIGGSLYARRCLFVSHPPTHSRARREVQADDDPVRSMASIGSVAIRTTNGGDVDTSGSHFWRIGRALQPAGSAITTPIRFNIDDCYFDQIWSDCVYPAVGTFDITANRVLFGRITSATSDLYQSRREIEVNVGNGWVPFSAAGIAVSALPLGRRASYFGRYDFATGTPTTDPIPDRTAIIRSFARGSSTRADRPGFQWHSAQARWKGEDRQPAAGDVYVVTQDAAPSPETPWVRLTFDLGYWSSASNYVQTGNPATQQTGTHSDNIQINRTSVIVTNIVAAGMVQLGDAQTLFLTGNTTMAAGDSDIRAGYFNGAIVVSRQSVLVAYDWAKTAGAKLVLSNWLALPMQTRYRYTDGKTPTLTFSIAGPNNTIEANSVFVGFRGATPVNAQSGGQLAGAITKVGIGDVVDYVTTPPAGLPAITHLLDSQWLDPATYAVRDDIDPLDEAFRFTAAGEALTGLALNAMLRNARGNHRRWNEVKAVLARYHRAPDLTIVVPAASPVGTVVATGVKASAWLPLYSGAEKGYFAFDSGRIIVAKSLAGISECWLLVSAADEHFLFDIQP